MKFYNDDNSNLIIDFNNTILLSWNNYGLKFENEYQKTNNVEIKNLTVHGMLNKQTFRQKIRLMIKLFKLIFLKK